MKILLFLILICGYGRSYGFSEGEFCQELIKQNIQKDVRISTIDAFKILYNPKSMIEPVSNREESNSKVIEHEKKIVFVHLPSPEFDQGKIDQLHQIQKEIVKLKLYKKLRKVKYENDCLVLISQFSEDFTSFKEYIHLANELTEETEKEKEASGLKQLKKKLKSFQRKGWRIVYAPNWIEFYNILEKDRPQQILLIAHSDEKGRLYDAQKNILPSKAFYNLPEELGHLIFYSCNSLEVIKYYEIEKALDGRTLTFPELKDPFKQVFGEKIPLISIKSMLKIRATPSTPNETRLCNLRIKAEKQMKNLLISINDVFIGSLNQEYEAIIPVKCSLIKEKNLVKIFPLRSMTEESLQIKKLTLHLLDHEIDLNIKDYISQTTKHHLVTIGTNGGIP